MLSVVVAGAAGRMGGLCATALTETADLRLAGTLVRGSDAAAVLERLRPDVLLDFTVAEASRILAPLAAERGVAPVVGTSGLDDRDVEALQRACTRGAVGGLLVPNFSLGAVLQMRFAEQAAALLPCPSIAERHHPAKRDRPSGTALATARRVEAARERAGLPREEPALSSERVAGIVAEQDLVFATRGERLELRHAVLDRSAYVPGVLLALRRVRSLDGLVVGLDALLG